jgi:hypothetical protein
MQVGEHRSHGWLSWEKYVPRLQKRTPDGKLVVLSQDARAAWCVGSPGEPQFDPYPLGEFASMEAARRYADQHFPGGEWEPVAR